MKTKDLEEAAVTLSRPFTLIEGSDMKYPVLRGIMDEDMKGIDTPLKLMKRYADILNKETSYGDIDDKLDALFLCGKAIESLDGYYHGITISLKTGIDSNDILTEIGKSLFGAKIDQL